MQNNCIASFLIVLLALSIIIIDIISIMLFFANFEKNPIYSKDQKTIGYYN